jgi:endonuclease G
MHVTNAVPQMQPFNGGVWLELENYALQNARKDDMRISVFTGPFLAVEDPVRFGVRIPTEFWKVIAFIHDGTGQLCATGYTMSQQDFLREEEFVFGKHKTAQRSIASIEQRAGLSFGALTALDPFEDIEGLATELTDLRQIRFVAR